MTPPPIDPATVEELKRLSDGIEGLDYGHHAVEIRRLMYRQRAALIAAAEENVRLREELEWSKGTIDLLRNTTDQQSRRRQSAESRITQATDYLRGLDIPVARQVMKILGVTPAKG